ncbi:hypothetical protein PIIN_06530 [Serendipita indica DSM 11827]|uniref:G domain-containing protein n=1 Tax=Serendipita indica (strain DSM 11827) TaxID=1109443 RepID=G4TMP5_SERID|nr:hypothetical protein PIIN_06530 [Serendipita indica DSM 11827]
MSSNYRISQTDKVVVVMGPTGAGKSTFINYATRGDGGGIGHALKSCTDTINVTPAKIGDDVVVFVDTPGFDDTFKSDIEILSMIAEFLVKLHQTGIKISCLLYFHRITDNRMAGAPLKNLELFTSLCGRVAMPHATLVTTMWTMVDPKVAEARLHELKHVFWKKMIEDGCKVKKFKDSQQSALDIIESNENDRGVLLTEEIIEKHRKLKATEAGIALNKQLAKLMQDRKAANRRLKQLARKQGNPAAKQTLNSEIQALDQGMQDIAKQLSRLNLPFTATLKRMFFGQSAVSAVPAA